VDITAMKELILNVLKLSENVFFHLVETRVVMESAACNQAAIRCSNKDWITEYL
jgi:DNA-binding FadR family transcriptional regulator